MTESKINSLVGNNIRKYRLMYNASKGSLTQKDLAKRIGVSTSLIGGLESKKVSQGISLFNLYKISEVLDIPIEKFFE